MPSSLQVNTITSYTSSSPVTIDDKVQQGNDTVATGYRSHAEGSNTQASGGAAHAEGVQTVASGLYSHSEGSNTEASGLHSHSEGSLTLASGSSSHAEGQQTISSGPGSHAEGWDTKATAQFSHSEGHFSEANGEFSHSEGYGCFANGKYSHAEGQNSKANSYGSHAEGNTTTANGVYSHTSGLHSTSNAGYQTVIGKYNALNSDEGAFIIGNGTSTSNTSSLLVASNNEVQVFGKTSTETIQISDGAVDGYVLTSDASGNGTWQSVAGVSDTFVTAASLNGTDLEIDRNNGQPQLTVDLSSLAVDTNNYLTNATLNGTLLELDRLGLSTLTVDLASINTDTFVVSGAYDDVSNTITLTRNDAGTIDITGIADSYVTGAALNGSTLELTRNEGLPTLSVDLSSLLDNTTSTVDASADPSVTTDIIFYSASSPGGSIYLDSSLNVVGKKVVLIRVADTNTVTLVGSGGAQLNGSGTKALPTLLYSTTTCISDGTNWYCTNGSVL